MRSRSFLILIAPAVSALVVDAPFRLTNSTSFAGTALSTGVALSTGTAGPTKTGSRTTATLPPGATATEGILDLPNVPNQCTGSIAPFQTSFWMQSNQMQIDDAGGWWANDNAIPWTFSTNTTDVVFGMPSFPGASGQDGLTILPNVTKRQNGSTLTVNLGYVDDESSLLFSVWNTNGTSFDGWKQEPGNPLTVYPIEEVLFFVNITGSKPCAHPVGNTSCAANTVERNADSWSAYGVDNFLSDWIESNKDSFKDTGMIQKFVEDFNIGSGKSCVFSSQCQLIDTCDSLPNGGKDENSAQVYLALTALQNLSDLFNRVWTSLIIGETDTMTQIAQIAMQFHYLNGTTTATNPTPWSIASGSMGIMSSILGFIPGLETAGSIVGLGSAVMGMVSTASSAQTTRALPDSQYATNQANISQYLGDYVQSMRASVEDTYTAIFNDGFNVTQLLQGGQTVNRTDLNLDCSSCEEESEKYTELYLGLKMVNQMWWQQNAFITFMPYGKIVQVDTYEETTFNEDDCGTFFLQTDTDKLLTVCHTDEYGWDNYLGPGMARLNWYWPGDPQTQEVDRNGYGRLNISHGPPGYDSSNAVFNTTGDSTYTFAATDVIESSLRGWIQGGFAYDGVENAAKQALAPALNDDDQAEAIQALFQMNATSAGMFSIPVCVLKDLNRWPTYWSTDGRIGGDYYSPCQGSQDRMGRNFEDFVSPDLKAILTTQYISDGTTEPVGPGQILGGENGHVTKRK